jgi:5-methylcytosine-specific restriction endonuclease McrA
MPFQSEALRVVVKQTDGVEVRAMTIGNLRITGRGRLHPRKRRLYQELEMSYVFVVDQQRRPLPPIHPGRARYLLQARHAAVLRRYPFTLIVRDPMVQQQEPPPLRLKLDPGSKTTGIAIVDDQNGQVIWAAELTHRGHAITVALKRRRAVRRARRQRKTRYRKSRFQNRRRRAGWIPPSLESRVCNMLTWVQRLRRFCSLTAISLELVKFDTQCIQNPEISGIEYQQGTLAGYELRKYLLEKWGRRCAYCGASNVPLQVEHILCRAKGGTNRPSSLTLACEPCNVAKGTQDIREFLKGKSELLQRILAQAKAPLKDAAAVNTTRWTLYERVKAVGLPVETGSGGRTQWNRTTRELPKAHWLDAACVGASTPAQLELGQIIPLVIAAKGRGSRQRVNVDAAGFPRGKPKAATVVQGFRTGDVVRAEVPVGKNGGVHVGRVLVRASGSFDITTKAGRMGGIAARSCHPIHHNDGYSYQKGEAALTPHAVISGTSAPPTG